LLKSMMELIVANVWSSSTLGKIISFARGTSGQLYITNSKKRNSPKIYKGIVVENLE
jgi:hypothetical protein